MEIERKESAARIGCGACHRWSLLSLRFTITKCVSGFSFSYFIQLSVFVFCVVVKNIIFAFCCRVLITQMFFIYFFLLFVKILPNRGPIMLFLSTRTRRLNIPLLLIFSQTRPCL